MWKMFTFAIVWKSVTATLRSSGFSKNRESSVKEFLCFGTHENLSSPLDNDNAWNTLFWQLGMFWVGMDICLHNYLIKEKEHKREKHFNMKILHCHIPQVFHHCSLHTLWVSVDILQHRETRICCLTIFVCSNKSCSDPFVQIHNLSGVFLSWDQWSPEAQHSAALGPCKVA